MKKSILKKYFILICILFPIVVNAQDSGNFIWPSDYRVLNPRSPVASWGAGDDWCYDNGWFHVQIYFENSERATHHYYVKRGDVNRIWRRRSSISIMREFVSKSSDLTVKYHGKNGGNSFGEFVLSESVDLQTDNYTAKFVSEEGAYNAISKDHSNDVTFILHLLRFKYQLVYDGNGNTGGTVPATWKSDKWVDDGFTGPTIQKQSVDKGIWDYADDCSYSWLHELATPNLTKPAYIHTGWSYTRNGTKIEGGNANITGTGHAHINDDSNPVSTTVYAVWEAAPYAATFNENGGSVSPAGSSYTIEKTFTLPTPAIRTGYKFTGWKVTSVGSDSNGWKVGDIYSAGATSTLGYFGDVTFTAQWEDQYKYSVIYDYNGGTKGGNTSNTEIQDWCDAATYTVPYSHLYDKSIYPAKANRIMAGWYTAPSGGSAAFVNEVNLTGKKNEEVSTTIYAQWCNNIYASIDRGTAEPSSQTIKEWQNSIAVVFTPATGYQITNVTKKLGSGTASTISGLTFPLAGYTYPSTGIPDAEVNLVATTTAIQYILTLNPDGGSVDPTSIAYTIEDDIILPTPSKTGFDFAGWKVTAAGGNWTTSDPAYTGTVPAGKYGNATLTAQWTKNGYKITYDANGGTVSSSEQVYDYETDVTLLTPQRPGYHFLNWKVKETSGSWTKDETYASGTALGPEKYGNVTMVAQWEEGESDLTVSITNLQTDEYVLFKAVGLTGKGKDKEYTVALNSAKTSVSMKELPIGSYRVTALYWSQSEDVTSVVNPTTVTEDHDIAGGYEFKFVASKKTSPQPHVEASKNNVWAK